MVARSAIRTTTQRLTKRAVGPSSGNATPPEPGTFEYRRPGGTDKYLRPDGTSLYKRPASIG